MCKYPIPASFEFLNHDHEDDSTQWIDRKESLILTISEDPGPMSKVLELHGCVHDANDNQGPIGEGNTWDELVIDIRDHSTPAKSWRANAEYRQKIGDLMTGKV